MIDRRTMLASAAGLILAPAAHAAPAGLDLDAVLRAAEARSGGRIGFLVDDTGSGRRYGWRADERFPMASTFKALLVAAVLARTDAGKESLQRQIPVKPSDMLENSPVAQRHVGHSATIAALAEGAITQSDNSAANLLLATLGGPAGLTAWLRGIGDAVTRLDRIEPAMASATPGDPRDTTTPAAMVRDMAQILFGNVLAPASRQQLISWLVATTTGTTRLRAGLPADWRVGDKTGTGGHGTLNDVAIAWPGRPGANPILIACFITGATLPAEALRRVHADLARAVAARV